MNVPATPADAAAAVADLWARVRALAGGLADGDWRRPTPCSDWDVGDLLGHLSGVQTGFDRSAPQPEPPAGWAPPEGASGLDAWTAAAVAARRGWTPQQALTELDAAAAGHEARLGALGGWDEPAMGPLGPSNERDLFLVRCYDIWVHLQDLREALGLGVEDHDASPGAVAAYTYVLGRVPWLYAKRVGAAEGATLRFGLDAPAGVDTVLVVRDGRAAFDAEAAPGDCAVAADPAAFTLLVSGRGDEERWRDAGLLRWSGPRGEAFVQRARLFA